MLTIYFFKYRLLNFLQKDYILSSIWLILNFSIPMCSHLHQMKLFCFLKYTTWDHDPNDQVTCLKKMIRSLKNYIHLVTFVLVKISHCWQKALGAEITIVTWVAGNNHKHLWFSTHLEQSLYLFCGQLSTGEVLWWRDGGRRRSRTTRCFGGLFLIHVA